MPSPSRRDLARASLALAVGAGTSSPALPARSGGDVEFGPGDHEVSGDLVVRGTLVVHPGARLVIAAGATLALLGDLHAPGASVFAGAGRVDLSRSRVLAARPEWWGAVPDDPGADCEPAIRAALAAHIAVQLGPGDYYLHRTLAVERHNRRLWGIGRTNAGRGTRLVLAGAEGTVLRVGPEAPPPSINDYLRGVDVRWIELGRTQAPRDRAGPGREATGLTVRHVLDCTFEGLRANEHAIGYSFRGAVRTLATDCAAFRSLFPGRADDVFVGFDLDGTDSPIDTGANASLYLIDCVARTGDRPSLAGAVGCRLTGSFSDTFLVRFETTQLGYGVTVDGGKTRSRYAQLDLHLNTPVLDQCGRAGVAIRGLGETAMVDVVSPWISVPAGADAAFHVADCGGAVSIVAGQMVATGGSRAAGILIERSTGIGIAGTKLLDVMRPVEARGASGFDLAPVVLAGSARADIAVALLGCAGGVVRARLLGSDRFEAGVSLDGACRTVTVETAGLGGARAAVRTAMPSPSGTAAVPGVVVVP